MYRQIGLEYEVLSTVCRMGRQFISTLALLVDLFIDPHSAVTFQERRNQRRELVIDLQQGSGNGIERHSEPGL
jgi:hypothetical protein